MSVVLKLSPLRRLIPGHEMRCPPEGNRLMWMTILATMTCAPSFFDAGNRGHLLDVGAKGARSCLHLPIELPVGVIENIDLIEMKPQQEPTVLSHATAKGLAQVLL